MNTIIHPLKPSLNVYAKNPVYSLQIMKALTKVFLNLLYIVYNKSQEKTDKMKNMAAVQYGFGGDAV